MFWLRLLARMVLTAAAGLMLWAVLPAAWGWHPTTVMSDSMAPRILRGDVVVSLPADAPDVALGRVVLVADPDHPGRLRLHRLVDRTGGGELITKGDANPGKDSTPVEPSALRGVAFLRVPYVGLPIVWLREHDVTALGLFCAAALGCLVLGAGDPASAARRRTKRRTSPPLAGAIAVIAALALGATALTPGAHASFAGSVSAPVSSFSAAASFPPDPARATP